MAFSKTSVELETCTPQFAKMFATMPALLGERDLLPARLAFLRAHLKAGTFVSPTWSTVVDKSTGRKYRVNGQHSSFVLAELSADDFPGGLLATVEEYTTDDLAHDAFLIFDLFDHPRSVRSNVDVMNLHRSHFQDLKEVNPKLCLSLCNGIALYEAGRENGVVLPSRQRGGYLETPAVRNFVAWAAGFSGARHAWLVAKPGVVAEMLANYLNDEQQAEEFWLLVFNESHPDVDHETRELSRTLRGFVGKPKVGQDRFRREAAKQWRRFRRSVAPVTTESTPAFDELMTSGTEATAIRADDGQLVRL